jgi:hypothetical protein
MNLGTDSGGCGSGSILVGVVPGCFMSCRSAGSWPASDVDHPHQKHHDFFLAHTPARFLSASTHSLLGKNHAIAGNKQL